MVGIKFFHPVRAYFYNSFLLVRNGLEQGTFFKTLSIDKEIIC